MMREFNAEKFMITDMVTSRFILTQSHFSVNRNSYTVHTFVTLVEKVVSLTLKYPDNILYNVASSNSHREIM